MVAAIPGTRRSGWRKGEYSSAGEHILHTDGVTGSIPVTPTSFESPGADTAAGAFRFDRAASRPDYRHHFPGLRPELHHSVGISQ